MANNEKFNEATRVQMPALVHLHRLGYNYFGKISEDMANTTVRSKPNRSRTSLRQAIFKRLSFSDRSITIKTDLHNHSSRFTRIMVSC